MSKFKSGDVCAICGKEWTGGARFINHHTDYEKDTTVVVCKPCHNVMHNSAVMFKHPMRKLGRDKFPYEFAKKVIEVYESKT